jgi:two-component system NtrC family sensor kinase
MLRWPIRLKLMVGLSVVVGMMVILMVGSTFGLHAFHTSNLKLGDQYKEIKQATQLFECIFRLHPPHQGTAEEIAELRQRVRLAQEALQTYGMQLLYNKTQGSRPSGWEDARLLALVMDEHLAEMLSEVDPSSGTPKELFLFPGTEDLLSHPEQYAGFTPAKELKEHIEQLNDAVSKLPQKLHADVWAVLQVSQMQYHTSRVMVWTSAIMVLGMLFGLMSLFHRWVLSPVRMLQRGVRHVTRGSFDYKIDLKSGDEMQDLAEAFNDMTAQISLTYADLEHQVQERSRQLVRSERLAGVGFLAAGVAHEINNPLASIAFCAEALENRLTRFLENTADADQRVISNYLKMIQEEAFRCKSITEKLLDFSRCNEIKRERIDLVSLVQGVVEMIRHIGKYRDKSIHFAPRESVMAHADSQEIKQVVLNLIVNALEAMEPRGMLRIDLRYNQGMAEMAFSDDGCGMSAGVLENIFEPFYTNRRDGKGTGLGLSIAHRIVSQHHGEIMAASPGEKHGSTFTVRLPIHPTEISEDSPSRSRASARRRGEPAPAIAS